MIDCEQELSSAKPPADTPWRPTTDQTARQLRAAVYRAVREFFHRRRVLEVETPILSAGGNTDPNIESFTIGRDGERRYLRTSPEFAMKRLLAADSGPIYELGRVFRRGESGRRHNPEFTMLEWYRPGFDDRELASEVADLVNAVARTAGRELTGVRFQSFQDLGRRIAPGLDLLSAKESELAALAADRGWYEGPITRRDALDLILGFGIPEFNESDQLLVVHDFPPELAALAVVDGAPPVARRFEVYLGAEELANGYLELTDPHELGQRLDAENRRRHASGQRPVAIDNHLVEAHRHGLPACAGVALGMDRLIGWCLQSDTIQDTINFPWDRA